MNFIEVYRSGIENLLLNRLRSFLSLLGVIIGVGGMVAVVTVGDGGKEKIREFVKLMGTDTFRIESLEYITGKQTKSGHIRLSDEDFIAVKRYCPTVVEITEVIPLMLNAPNENIIIEGSGVTPSYRQIGQVSIIEGRFINEVDIRERRYVCVVEDSALVIKTLGHKPKLGEFLIFGTDRFELVGISRRKKLIFERENVLELFVPQSVALEKTGAVMGEVYVQATSQRTVSRAMREVREILRSRYSGQEPFQPITHSVLLKEGLKQINSSTMVMAGIAFLSLIVGGIGIMNVMLVTVKERTREIGVRKAVGATSKDILIQFILETSILCIIGGILGIAIGLLVSYYIVPFLDVPFTVSVRPLLVGFIFSVLVGVFSGTYPAVQASKLEPVEALRHE